jgi:radical SAM protein with 4Fe4S-binding SPASM domain
MTRPLDYINKFSGHLLKPGYVLRRLYLYTEKKLLKSRRVLCGPVRVKLNSGYKCNLGCPLCPTGRKSPANCHELTVEDVRFLLLRLGKFYYISLFGWAETFLVRDIFTIIAMIKDSGKHVDIDSNLSFSNEKILAAIENSNLDFLSVSLDGVDQQSYAQYRHGGSFNLVIENIRRLRTASKGPKNIEWQYLVTRKNIQYMAKAKEMAEELGIDICFQDIGMYLDMFYANSPELEREWRTDEQIDRMARFCSRGTVCNYMYNDPFIDPDGRVYPCCNAARAPKSLIEAGYENVFGDLHEHTLAEIWNNEYYQMMRSLFAGRKYKGKQIKPICLMCKVYFDSRGIERNDRPVFKG